VTTATSGPGSDPPLARPGERRPRRADAAAATVPGAGPRRCHRPV